MAPMPPPSSALTAASEPPAPLRVPIRFQCPLCLDVLRRPVLLPCCRRHLCMECFERALELTSVNCGFCRRRIVGFARTKQNKVDEALWRTIRAQCAFLTDEADGMEDVAPAVEFVDEDAPPRHSQGEDHPTRDARPGELQAFYEQQLRAHQSRQRADEQRALRQTLAFLEADAEYQAASAPPPIESGRSSAGGGASASGFRAIPAASTPATGPHAARRRHVGGGSALRPRGGRSGPSHRPLTRSKSQVDAKQQRLDGFFAPSRIVTRSMTPDPTSDAETPTAGDRSDEEEHPHKPRRRRRREEEEEEEEEGEEDADAYKDGDEEPPRTRSQTRTNEQEAMLITRHNHYPRSSSHSPKRPAPGASKPLFQTTLVARAPSSGHDGLGEGADALSRSGRRANSTDGAPGRHLVVSATPSRSGRKMLTRQGSRRAWKCPHCTFENTCFDSRCSMCHSVPPASAYTPL